MAERPSRRNGRAAFQAWIYARPTALTLLPDGHPRQGPGDDQALDLARALEDRVDRGVAVRHLREYPGTLEFSGVALALRRVACALFWVAGA